LLDPIKRTVSVELSEFSTLTNVPRKLVLQLEISREQVSGTLNVVVYTPYWVHNASGLPLMFRHHHVSSYTKNDRPIIAGQFGDVLSEKKKNSNDFHLTSKSTTLLGAGPRKMGLRELLPGPQGEGRQGLREARSVSTLRLRKEIIRQRRILQERDNDDNNDDKIVQQSMSTTRINRSTTRGRKSDG
jgi:hypothetical protein